MFQAWIVHNLKLRAATTLLLLFCSATSFAAQPCRSALDVDETIILEPFSGDLNEGSTLLSVEHSPTNRMIVPQSDKRISIKPTNPNYQIEICQQNSSDIVFSIVEKSDSSELPFFYVDNLFSYQATFQLTLEEDSLYRLRWQTQKSFKAAQCPRQKAQFSLSLSDEFNDGDKLIDFVTKKTFEVKNNSVLLPPSEKGYYLLAKDHAPKSKSSETAYYVLLDRFNNGDTSNDLSYGRTKDNEEEIATFHGGDIAGLISKLDHIKNLGVNTLVISNPLEQIHGWVGGGKDGDFKHFAYHGFYTKDYRNIDQNFGSWELLEELGTEVRNKGMRLFINVVVNHPGLATFADMQKDGFGGLLNEELMPSIWTNWKPGKGENWHSFTDYIDFDHPAWDFWWGKDWIRANLSDHTQPGENVETKSVHYLPDFINESKNNVAFPSFLEDQKEADNTVANFLIDWHLRLAKASKASGFLIDAEPHLHDVFVKKFKTAMTGINPNFEFIAERFGQPFIESNSFSRGNDYLLNYELQDAIKKNASICLSDFDALFERYSIIHSTYTKYYSFASWLDTYLVQDSYKYDEDFHLVTGMALAFIPSAAMIFYGDETIRRAGPSGSEYAQGTRSDMVWKYTNEQLNSYDKWKQIFNFRKIHPALEFGAHKKLSDQPYAFTRNLKLNQVVDNVIIVIH